MNILYSYCLLTLSNDNMSLAILFYKPFCKTEKSNSFCQIGVLERRGSKPGIHQNETRVSKHKAKEIFLALQYLDPCIMGSLSPADSTGHASQSLVADLPTQYQQDCALPLHFYPGSFTLPASILKSIGPPLEAIHCKHVGNFQSHLQRV